jgi:hypothetical protein
MKKVWLYISAFIIISSHQNTFADCGKPALEGGIVDCGVVQYHAGKEYEDEYTVKGQTGEIVIKVFTNKLSGHQLYYEGADGWGGGVYYIIKDGEKREICRKYNRWDPVVCWYGSDIVEIWIGSNISWPVFQYYDYTSETYKEWPYRNPLCIDMKNHYIVWSDYTSIFVTDIRTYQEVIEYVVNEDDIQPHKAWIENGKLIVLFGHKQIVFDYPY